MIKNKFLKYTAHFPLFIFFLIIFIFVYQYLSQMEWYYVGPLKPLFTLINFASIFSLTNFWLSVIILLNFLLIYLLLVSIFSKNKKIRNMGLFIIFLLYSIALLGVVYSEFKEFFYIPTTIKFGSGNFIYILFHSISYIIIAILTLCFMNKNINYKSIMKSSIRYFITIIEVMLGLLISLVIIRWELQESATMLDAVGWWLFLIGSGFFFFIILEIVKEYLLKKLDT